MSNYYSKAEKLKDQFGVEPKAPPEADKLLGVILLKVQNSGIEFADNPRSPASLALAEARDWILENYIPRQKVMEAIGENEILAQKASLHDKDVAIMLTHRDILRTEIRKALDGGQG